MGGDDWRDDRFRLACPFLTHTPDFAAGVRLGLFWAALRDGPDRLPELVSKADEEQFRVAATRRGYRVAERQEADPGKPAAANDWLVVVYERTARTDELEAAEGEALGPDNV